ncbi:uncharacterized protein V6R79_004003 [Siganus canaliculatus]
MTASGNTTMRFALIPLTYFVALMPELGLCCRPKEYKAGDGQCCPMCDQGSVVRKDCTTLSGTGCKQCESGTYMNHPNGLKNCRTCTTCDKGQGLAVLKMCTTTSDTVCGALSGYFCTSLEDDTGCSFAEKHSLCSAGERIKDPGTSQTDTVCEPCPTGSFSTDGVKCTAWTVCSTEEVRTIEGSAASDVVCARAERNHYSICGSVILLVLTVVLLVIKGITSRKTTAYFVAVMTVQVLCCRPKEYKAGDGQCCPMCDEGSVVKRDCTTLSGTGCKQCENGTYMNSPNGLKNCWACTTCDKGQGLAVLKMCTTTSDTVCGALSGYFCTSRADETGCSFAEKHSLCSAGQRIKDPGTSQTDTVCEPCPTGSFSTDGVKCTAWTV